MTIRVMLVGLGPIGAAVGRQLASRRGFRIVGAVDIDPRMAGRDAGEVIGLGRPLRVRVQPQIGAAIRNVKPDVAVLCTSSRLADVVPQFEEVVKRGVPIVTTTEEAAYPSAKNRRLFARLDRAARTGGVAILGTGVNPGFTMDALPIVMTAACERVDRIEVHRVQDARIRRLPFQQKIGAGLTRSQFEARVRDGSVRHVGFTESIQMIGDALGWKLERITDQVKAKIAAEDVTGELLSIRAGRVAGIVQDGIGYVGGAPRILLHLEAYLGAQESYDSILIEGSPRLYSRVAGGVHGDIATASMAVNSIPKVLAADPGFHTMRDLPLPSFWGGSKA